MKRHQSRYKPNPFNVDMENLMFNVEILLWKRMVEILTCKAREPANILDWMSPPTPGTSQVQSRAWFSLVAVNQRNTGICLGEIWYRQMRTKEIKASNTIKQQEGLGAKAKSFGRYHKSVLTVIINGQRRFSIQLWHNLNWCSKILPSLHIFSYIAH